MSNLPQRILADLRRFPDRFGYAGRIVRLPRRLLLGPGPSNVHPRVLAAQASPLLGHLDPAFLEVLDGVRERLRPLAGRIWRIGLMGENARIATVERLLCALRREIG